MEFIDGVMPRDGSLALCGEYKIALQVHVAYSEKEAWSLLSKAGSHFADEIGECGEQIAKYG